MKRSFSTIVIIIFTTILLSCSSKSKPEDTLDKFLSAAQKLDTQAMSETIDPTNTKSLNSIKGLLSDEEDDITVVFYEYLKNNARKISYNIVDSELSGDEAVVTTKIKYVNGGPFVMETFDEMTEYILAMSFSKMEPTEEEANQMFQTIMDEQSKTSMQNFMESEIKVYFVNKDNKWYISHLSDELLDAVLSGFISLENEFDN